MRLRGFAALAAAIGLAGTAHAQSDTAKAFGAREGVEQIALSPDGKHVVFVAPSAGSGNVAYVAALGATTVPRMVLVSDGKPERISSCRWASDTRLVCQIHLTLDDAGQLIGYSRLVSLNADGSDLKMLTARTSAHALGITQSGGGIIDWLTDEQGAVLMTRTFVPEQSIGTHLAEMREGVGVERVDVATLRRSLVENPRRDATDFVSDGHGVLRVMGTMHATGANYDTGLIHYFYQPAAEKGWKPLGDYDVKTGIGFMPIAVDRALDAAYGFEKKDGRQALYRIKLDGTGAKELVFARTDVDVDDLLRIGRSQRVIGVTYATDKREAQFFDPQLRALAGALSRALPGLPLIRFLDANADESKLLLWAGSDVDPGRYYVFDRTAKRLDEIMLARPELEHATLAPVKPIQFAAADGTQIPGYLTLPPGSEGKKLPAIVMPHGGPASRDEWGFDWLAQFFAARGFAVLQPNFRGSTGYGDSWFVDNGFKSWKIAIGDVNDGGRWLVAQGIADPARLAVVGWSYGGYAALQSSVLDPDLYKAIVAVAPVTDLEMFKNESLYYTNYSVVADYIGTGDHIREGSPARNAARIKAPVLLFHGDMDQNVGVQESRVMTDRLREAGASPELVIFPGLDHQLPDSAARAQLLDRADSFLRKSLGM